EAKRSGIPYLPAFLHLRVRVDHGISNAKTELAARSGSNLAAWSFCRSRRDCPKRFQSKSIRWEQVTISGNSTEPPEHTRGGDSTPVVHGDAPASIGLASRFSMVQLRDGGRDDCARAIGNKFAHCLKSQPILRSAAKHYSFAIRLSTKSSIPV